MKVQAHPADSMQKSGQDTEVLTKGPREHEPARCRVKRWEAAAPDAHAFNQSQPRATVELQTQDPVLVKGSTQHTHGQSYNITAEEFSQMSALSSSGCARRDLVAVREKHGSIVDSHSSAVNKDCGQRAMRAVKSTFDPVARKKQAETAADIVQSIYRRCSDA